MTGAAGLLTAMALFINNTRKPDKTTELLNATISDALALRQQVQTLFASSTQAFQEGLAMRGQINDLEDRISECAEEVSVLKAHDNRELAELQTANHRLRTQIVELEHELEQLRSESPSA